MPRLTISALIEAMLMMRPPVPASAHGAADDLRAQEAAREVEIHLLLPSLERLGLDGHAHLAVAHVVDEDVDRSHLVDDSLARLLAISGHRHVGFDSPRLPATRPNLPSRLVERVLCSTGDDDVGAGIS